MHKDCYDGSLDLRTAMFVVDILCMLGAVKGTRALAASVSIPMCSKTMLQATADMQTALLLPCSSCPTASSCSDHSCSGLAQEECCLDASPTIAGTCIHRSPVMGGTRLHQHWRVWRMTHD